MGDEYQYNTFSIDEHFNEDEPQPKLTDIILEVETYFEKKQNHRWTEVPTAEMGKNSRRFRWQKVEKNCGCPKIS